MLFCVDVGLVNMGVALVEVDHKGVVQCHMAGCVDITDFRCRGCCPLRHEAVPVDWVDHFVRDFKDAIAQAQVVLIERQPPGGFRCVEQLIYKACRDKALLVQPRSFQAHFGVTCMEYDERKQYLVGVAQRIYRGSEVATRALAADRAHDVADALLFAVHHASRPEVRYALLPSCERDRLAAADVDLERYIYPKAKERCRRGGRRPKMLNEFWEGQGD